MILSKEQEIASQSLDGPSMIIAVPGAGKTTILLKRIENLIKSGVSPEKILTITFSKAAASELKERFSLMMPNIKVTPHFYTIHAFSYMILRDFGRAKGIDFKLLEGSKNISKYKLLSDFYREVHKDYISEEKLENLVNKIGYIKNMMLSPKDIYGEFDRFEEIFSKYEAYKKKFKYIDFDDMLELGLKILETEKSLKNKYINMYDFIQVDEGQDTSKLQMEIVKLLTKKKRNLFIVADDDQSIYSFRGADPQGLFDLERFFPELKTYYMETNFRCSKNIVTAANNFIDQNKIRYSKNLRPDRGFSSPVEVVKVNEPSGQYEYILDKIAEYPLEDIGILYRNNVSAVGLVEFLEKKDIDFKIGDSNKIRFFSHRISTDILNILEFSEDMTRIDLLNQFFYKVNGYISRAMINDLKYSAKAGNVIKNLMELDSLKPYSIKELTKLEQNFNRLRLLSIQDKLAYIENDMGYGKYLNYSSKKESLGLQGEKLVFESLKKISQGSKDVTSFKGRLKYLDSLLIQAKKSNSGLNLSTVHSAKGKEYKHVFIIDVYDGMFPTKSDREVTPVEVEEERRLFYVAMTRAKDSLTILFPDKVGSEKTEVSQFLIELQEACK